MQINGSTTAFISQPNSIGNKGGVYTPITIDAKAIVEPAHTYTSSKNKFADPIVNSPSQLESQDKQQGDFIRLFASQAAVDKVANNPVTLAPDLPRGVLDYIQNSQLTASDQGRLFDEMV